MLRLNLVASPRTVVSSWPHIRCSRFAIFQRRMIVNKCESYRCSTTEVPSLIKPVISASDIRVHSSASFTKHTESLYIFNMASNDEAVELTAQCLCKSYSVSTSVPTSALPLHAWYCHCTSCRHLTGYMYSSWINWPGTTDAVRALALREYAFSHRITISFCGKCSSPMFITTKEPDATEKLDAFTGVLSNNDIPGMVKVMDHTFVGDTLDGGAAIWLRYLSKDKSGAPLPCYRGYRDELVDPDAMAATQAKTRAAPLDEIPIRCHCKGVDLVLRRGVADYSAMDRSKLPFFVDPSTFKLVVGFETCNSCRVSAGVDIINWTFAELKYLDFVPSSDASSSAGFPSNTSDLKAAVSSADRHPRLGHLAYYASSDKVQRYFCSRCSATVFYAVDDRPNMVDLATGVLDAPDGARAESVLDWTLGTMIWEDDVKGGWREELVASVARNAEDWRIENNIPRSFARQMLDKRNAMAKTAAQT